MFCYILTIIISFIYQTEVTSSRWWVGDPNLHPLTKIHIRQASTNKNSSRRVHLRNFISAVQQSEINWTKKKEDSCILLASSHPSGWHCSVTRGNSPLRNSFSHWEKKVRARSPAKSRKWLGDWTVPENPWCLLTRGQTWPLHWEHRIISP